jgi:hypothetical protein
MSKVGQVLETPDDELLKIRNFGEKSLEELKGKIVELGLDGSGPIQTDALAGIAEKTPEWRSAYDDIDEDLPVGFTGERSAVAQTPDEEEDEEDYFEDEDDEEPASKATVRTISDDDSAKDDTDNDSDDEDER